jgi:small subunit ribosomal protein S12
MPTISQLTLQGRPKPIAGARVPTLEAYLEIRGDCARVRATTPKKPNSAPRRVARMRLTKSFEAASYISGEGHNLLEQSAEMIRGVRHHIIRGTLDVQDVEGRRQRRSKYGAKRSK